VECCGNSTKPANASIKRANVWLQSARSAMGDKKTSLERDRPFEPILESRK